MLFLNGLTPELIMNREVTAVLSGAKEWIPNCKGCRIVLIDGVLNIDFIPRLKGAHIAPIPEKAFIAKTWDDEIWMQIPINSDAGQVMFLIRRMIPI